MKKKEEIKTLVDSYITENQLRPAEYLLKKELPASLMTLYEEKFDGMNMEGISTVEYLKEYKKFLKKLRKVYNVKESKELKKVK